MPQDVVDALEAQLGKRGSNGGSSSGNNANKVLLAQNAHLEKKVKLLEGQVSGWGRRAGEQLLLPCLLEGQATCLLEGQAKERLPLAVLFSAGHQLDILLSWLQESEVEARLQDAEEALMRALEAKRGLELELR